MMFYQLLLIQLEVTTNTNLMSMNLIAVMLKLGMWGVFLNWGDVEAISGRPPISGLEV